VAIGGPEDSSEPCCQTRDQEIRRHAPNRYQIRGPGKLLPLTLLDLGSERSSC
jgi:hypothetical protein